MQEGYFQRQEKKKILIISFNAILQVLGMKGKT